MRQDGAHSTMPELGTLVGQDCSNRIAEEEEVEAAGECDILEIQNM